MHLIEGGVIDVAGIDAGAQAAHQARRGGLAEDGRADGIDTDELQIWVELAQDAGDAGRVATCSHRTHQDINGAELGVKFQRQALVCLDVVGIVVLVGIPRMRVSGEHLGDLVAACALPAPIGMRLGDDPQIGAVGG